MGCGEGSLIPKVGFTGKSPFCGQINLEDSGVSKTKRACQTFSILMCSRLLQDLKLVLPELCFAFFSPKSFLVEYSKEVLFRGTHFGKHS